VTDRDRMVDDRDRQLGPSADMGTEQRTDEGIVTGIVRCGPSRRFL
jgi:hypothetical protein